jgi:hypothetical protein
MIKRMTADLAAICEMLAKSQDQDLVEYALVGFMVALGASAAVASIAIHIENLWFSLAARFPF